MFAETVAVDPRHLSALLDTLARTDPTPPSLPAALQELADALHGQDPDAHTWLVPAQALWTALHYANALDVFGLDECDAAMEALAEAELVLSGCHRWNRLR
ncbi:hypothetical protein [Nocardiopsis synnemataformans]|uniref:hypothetical protein n=1 Tax=Nocardiopsis synnemataformans TaxID=61305 RepID=UPI003EBFD938